MRRIFIFTALGTGLAIAGGVGLSTAHTMGLFAPAQTDWLTTSRVVTPSAPTTLPDIVPVVVRAPAPQLDAPQTTDVQPLDVRAPVQIVSPRIRPEIAAPAPPVQTVQAPAPRVAPQVAPAVTPRVSTRQAQTLAPTTPRVSQAIPAETAAQNPDPIDRVWMLGVFR